MKHGWDVNAEQTNVMADRAKQPDIVINDTADNFSIFIETEYFPANTLTKDAKSRLGQKDRNGQLIKMVLMLKIPQRYQKMKNIELNGQLKLEKQFKYAVIFADNKNFPINCVNDSNDWLKGSLRDIADLVQTINYTIGDTEKYIRKFKDAIMSASKNVKGSVPKKIAESLHQSEGIQTTNMGMAIILNAFLFQEILSGLKLSNEHVTNKTICTISQLREKDNNSILKPKTIESWKTILEINYYPIFVIALDLVDEISATQCSAILTLLGSEAEELAQQMKYVPKQDIMSTVFQEMISDAKFLAAFYTKPEAAALIATIVCPDDVTEPTKMQIADFACGTGILLHSVYRRVEQSYEANTELPMSKQHKTMMEKCLIGCDVLPSSVHLTTTSLAGMHLNEVFKPTKLYIMRLGPTENFKEKCMEYNKYKHKLAKLKKKIELKNKHISMLKRKSEDQKTINVLKQKVDIKTSKTQLEKLKADVSIVKKKIAGLRPENNVRCGSLELLKKEQKLTAWTTTDLSYRATSGSAKQVKVPRVEILPHACDIVVMNPPYSRDTNPEQKSSDVHHPVFAAFKMSNELQKILASRAQKIASDYPEIDGNAGLASNFMAIADTMLKDKGIMAIVLPLVFVQGESWKKVRSMILRKYDEILIITVASHKKIKESAFSANTGMRDMILVARKNEKQNVSKKRVMSIVLNNVPAKTFESLEIGKQILTLTKNGYVESIESKIGSGTPIMIGNTEVGTAMTETFNVTADLTKNIQRKTNISNLSQFKINCILDLSLAKLCHRLESGIVKLEGSSVHTIPITQMSEIGENGLLSRDINSDEKRNISIAKLKKIGLKNIEQDIKFICERGPFEFTKDKSTSLKTYPALEKHDFEQQNAMQMKNDSYLVPKPLPLEINPMFSKKQIQNVWEFIVNQTWKKSSKIVFATHFQFNSQPCVVGLTDRAVLGGSSFPNFILYNKKFEKAFVVWWNSTLGLLLFWWNSGKQQAGRGILTKEARLGIPVLDFSKLKEHQIDEINKIYNGCCLKPLKALHRIFDDKNRKIIDVLLLECLFERKLTYDEHKFLEEVYKAFANEPTVKGTK